MVARSSMVAWVVVLTLLVGYYAFLWCVLMACRPL
jgi:hypothetical protein